MRIAIEILLLIANIIIIIAGFYLTFSEAGKVFRELPDSLNNYKKEIHKISKSHEENIIKISKHFDDKLRELKSSINVINEKIEKTYGKMSKIDDGIELNGFKKTCIRVNKNAKGLEVYYDKSSNAIDYKNIKIGNIKIILRNSFEATGNPTITVSIKGTPSGKNKTKFAFGVSQKVFNILTDSNTKSINACEGIEFKIKPLN